MWGNGCKGVYVATCGEWDLLWGPVIMVNYENGGGVCVFFGFSFAYYTIEVCYSYIFSPNPFLVGFETHN
jgi:hypothetical protein